MKKTALILVIILFLSTIGLAATGDSNDPFYVVVHQTQLSTITDNQQDIITAQQQFFSDVLFLLQIIAIVCGLCWGGLTWSLILKAKNSKRFW